MIVLINIIMSGKLEKRNKERTPTSSEKEIVNNAKSDAIKNIYIPPNYPPVDPTASVPIGIYQKQRDIDLVEPEERVKKTKKTKEKAVLSLGEFNGDAQGDFPEAYGDHQVYRACRDLMLIFSLKERLARLACIKRTVEDQNPAPPYYSVPRTDVNQINLKVFAITICFQKVIPLATFYPPRSKISRFFHGMGTTSLHLFYLGSAVFFFFYQLQSNGEVAPQFSEKAPFSYFHRVLYTTHPLGSQLATMIMFSFGVGPDHSLFVNFLSILGDVTHGKRDITSRRCR